MSCVLFGSTRAADAVEHRPVAAYVFSGREDGDVRSGVRRNSKSGAVRRPQAGESKRGRFVCTRSPLHVRTPNRARYIMRPVKRNIIIYCDCDAAAH